MNHQDNLLGVLKTLFKWKKQILWTCFLAGIGSIVISLMLSDYYKSSTTFYAASPDMAKPEPVGAPLKERQYFGREPDIDRLIAIAESGEVANFLIKKFGLYAHYDIDSTQVKAAHKIRLKFGKLYAVKKTKYDGIELSMEDKEKQLATDIVNAARDKVNEIAQRLIKESQHKQLQTFESNIKAKEKDIQMFSDSLTRVRERFNIYSTISQGEVLSAQLSKTKSKLSRNKAKYQLLSKSSSIPRDSILLLSAEIKGAEAELIDLNKQVELFSKGRITVNLLKDILTEAGDQLSLDRERYKQLKVAYESNIPALIILEKGKIPLIKSRPKRSIIVIASVLVAFLFSVIAVLLMDTYRDVNWKEIING
ncbi:MAG TPA: hypothetical protein ENK52_01005 [Saprospiraceae bacterium]|nr:hypothetical protein [Saprospiraceae bacterium]